MWRYMLCIIAEDQCVSSICAATSDIYVLTGVVVIPFYHACLFWDANEHVAKCGSFHVRDLMSCGWHSLRLRTTVIKLEHLKVSSGFLESSASSTVLPLTLQLQCMGSISKCRCSSGDNCWIKASTSYKTRMQHVNHKHRGTVMLVASYNLLYPISVWMLSVCTPE